MRTIRKGPEPRSLTEYRLQTGATYEAYPNRDELRESLVEEQRGLCCYCLGRIRPEWGAMKVEHWRCQERYEDHALSYANLLGACLGNEGQPEHAQHCDTRKGNSDLSRNPANPDHRVSELIRYLGDGRVEAEDAPFNEELERVLNLNAAKLRNNRRSVVEAFHVSIGKRGELSRPQLEVWLREWSGDDTVGELPEYSEVVAYWLRKRLARM